MRAYYSCLNYIDVTSNTKFVGLKARAEGELYEPSPLSLI